MKKTVLLSLTAVILMAQSSSNSPQFTPAGELLLPKNYREWVFLSSGLGMTYGQPSEADRSNPRFDNVFVNPSAYRAFLETGRWPDKTMFILEIRRSIETASIDNGGRTQGDIVSIEAAVKEESRFPQKWAYFNFGRGEKATPFPADSRCNTCHGQNAAVENTFVQFYPTLLNVATRKGTLNSAYVEKSAGR